MCPFWSNREKDRDLCSICDLSSLFSLCLFVTQFPFFYLLFVQLYTLDDSSICIQSGSSGTSIYLFLSRRCIAFPSFPCSITARGRDCISHSMQWKGLKLETSFCFHSCLLLFHVSFACVFDVFLSLVHVIFCHKMNITHSILSLLYISSHRILRGNHRWRTWRNSSLWKHLTSQVWRWGSNSDSLVPRKSRNPNLYCWRKEWDFNTDSLSRVWRESNLRCYNTAAILEN